MSDFLSFFCWFYHLVQLLIFPWFYFCVVISSFANLLFHSEATSKILSRRWKHSRVTNYANLSIKTIFCPSNSFSSLSFFVLIFSFSRFVGFYFDFHFIGDIESRCRPLSCVNNSRWEEISLHQRLLLLLSRVKLMRWAMENSSFSAIQWKMPSKATMVSYRLLAGMNCVSDYTYFVPSSAEIIVFAH